MDEEHRGTVVDDAAWGSLGQALRAAREVAGDALDSPSPARDHTAPFRTRDELVDDAVAGIADGVVPGARSGVVDVLSDWLLRATLVSDLAQVEAAVSQVSRITSALERRRSSAGRELLEAVAELRGATVALAWVGRLAAEVFVGSELIGLGTLHGRMLAAIHASPGMRNSDLVDKLKSDKTQVSRAGRKLRDAGLVAVSRSGGFNHWRVTAKGAALLQDQRPQLDLTPQEVTVDATVITLRPGGMGVSRGERFPAAALTTEPVGRAADSWSPAQQPAAGTAPAKNTPAKKAPVTKAPVTKAPVTQVPATKAATIVTPPARTGAAAAKVAAREKTTPARTSWTKEVPARTGGRTRDIAAGTGGRTREVPATAARTKDGTGTRTPVKKAAAPSVRSRQPAVMPARKAAAKVPPVPPSGRIAAKAASRGNPASTTRGGRD